MTTQNTQDGPKPLEFESEPGSSRSKWLAGLFTVGLVAWMGSGFVMPPEEVETTERASEADAIAVRVLESQATPVTKTFSAEGQGQPDRKALLRPQASGEVIELPVRKGAMVEAGDPIARLATRELEARVQEAEQELERAQEDYANTQSLSDRGIATVTRLRESRAELATAEAGLAAAEEALDNAVIKAPFAGRLDSLDLEIGSYTTAGAEVGTVLDTDPLRIVIQIPQQTLGQVREGMEAVASFITGEQRNGVIDYISRDAESDTRTFRAEIVVPNPDGEIASGLSVQVRIPTEEVTAHFISPAILSLSEDGRLGVKTVEEGNTVAFHEVVVERAQRDGVWVSGLPDSARIITIGQGYVSEGQIVAPTAEATPIETDSSQRASVEGNL